MCISMMKKKRNSWHCLVSAKMQRISENKQKIDTVSTATRRILLCLYISYFFFTQIILWRKLSQYYTTFPFSHVPNATAEIDNKLKHSSFFYINIRFIYHPSRTSFQHFFKSILYYRFDTRKIISINIFISLCIQQSYLFSSFDN